jgi:hypothetical protein
MKIIIGLILSGFLFTCSSCNEKPGSSDIDISTLTISLSKYKILGDGIDMASINVINQDGLDVKKYVTVYIDDKIYHDPGFHATVPSISKLYASYGSIKSNEVTVEVIEDKNLKFEKNVLLEQYTGTWCGWCPRAVNQINTISLTDKKIVHVALHLSDEMTYSQNSKLFQSFGFTGVPTVHADRSVVWSGDAATVSAMHKPVRAGLALVVSGENSSVTAKVILKFGWDFSEILKLSVYLLDDGLIANQANYYNTDASSPYYQMGSPMINFAHKNVLIQIGTDMFGDVIPSDSVGIGKTYSKTFNFSGINPAHLSKIKVAAFITYGSGPGAKTVLNSIIGSIGSSSVLEPVSH